MRDRLLFSWHALIWTREFRSKCPEFLQFKLSKQSPCDGICNSIPSAQLTSSHPSLCRKHPAVPSETFENVQDSDNTGILYYFCLPSFDSAFSNLCTLHDCPLSLLDNLVLSVHILSGGVFSTSTCIWLHFFLEMLHVVFSRMLGVYL